MTRRGRRGRAVWGNGGERGGHGAVRRGVGDPLGEWRPWGTDRVLLQFGGEGDIHSELEGLGILLMVDLSPRDAVEGRKGSRVRGSWGRGCTEPHGDEG